MFMGKLPSQLSGVVALVDDNIFILPISYFYGNS